MKVAHSIALAGLILAAPLLRAQGTPAFSWFSQGHKSFVGEAAAAPNGNFCTASGSYLKVWKSSDRTQVAFLNTGTSQYAMGYYPDGSALVTSDSNNLHVRNPLTLAQIGSDIPISDLGQPLYLEVSKSGVDFYMLTVQANNAEKWKLVGGVWTRQFNWTGLPTWAHADLNAQASLWAFTNNTGNSVKVYNFTTPVNTAAQTLSVPKANGIDFSPTGTYLAVGTTSLAANDGLTIFNTSNWTVFQTILKSMGASLVRFSTGDQSLWTSDTFGRAMYISNQGYIGFRGGITENVPTILERTGTNVMIQDGFGPYPVCWFTSGLAYIEPAHSGRANGIAYREDNQTLYTAGADHYLNEWFPNTGVNQYRTDLTGFSVDEVVASAAADRVVTSSGSGTQGYIGFQIMDANLRIIRSLPNFGFGTRHIAMTQAPVGANGYLIALSDNNIISFYRASDAALLRTITLADPASVEQMAFSYDGTRMAVISQNSKVTIIRTTDYVVLQTITVVPTLYSVAWGLDSSTFFLATSAAPLTILPVKRTVLAPETFTVQAGFGITGGESAAYIASSRDHTTILAGTATRMAQFDSVNKAQLRYWDVNTTDVLAADFSGDNHRVAYSFDNGGFGVFPNIYAGAIKGLNFNKASVVRGGAFIATVTLTLPAPAGGTQLQLRTGTANITPQTFNFTVPAGATQVAISLTTNAGMTAGSYPIVVQNMAVPTGGTSWLKSLSINVTN